MTRVTRDLSPNTSLETFRRQAKRWLKDIRSGDTEAIARLRDALPSAGEPKLREVQQALAREYGFASWASLKEEIEDRALAAKGHAERVRDFLEHSVIRYGTPPGSGKWTPVYEDRPYRWARAAKLLARYPEIAAETIHTAVTAGDIGLVRRMLREHPAMASDISDYDGWSPLVRLASVRLPTDAAQQNGVAIARLLLEHGASPHVFWADAEDHYHFTVLTCAIGHGESGQPEHPQALDLVRLMFEQGAEPYDGQALYNTSLGEDDTKWLDVLWNESARRGETAKWLVKPRELHLPALDYLIGNAVNQWHEKRVAWLLAHGAKAGTLNPYSHLPVMKHALLSGATGIADELARHGAERPMLSGLEEFQAAVMRGDIDAARRMLTGHSEYLDDVGPMILAVQQNRIELVRALLDMGMSPRLALANGMTPLHEAAGGGKLEIARLLVSRGAQVDVFENRFGGTPLSWANHSNQQTLIDFLAPLSQNIRGLCFAAKTDRLRELLTEQPGLANMPIRPQEPPLYCLPDDDEKAVEVVEVLLAFGADPNWRNPEGLTPAESARCNGLEDAAALLDSQTED